MIDEDNRHNWELVKWLLHFYEIDKASFVVVILQTYRAVFEMSYWGEGKLEMSTIQPIFQMAVRLFTV